MPKVPQAAQATDRNPPSLIPPYIAWKTFEGYVQGLTKSTVPHTLDNSVRPASMAGGLWRQLMSCLQFLNLITKDKVVNEGLAKLQKAHGTAEWPKVVKEHVVSAYGPIVDGLPLENATSQQLDKCFREKGGIDGQMLDKAIRFYLHALRAAEVKYSDHLSIRKERGARKPRPPKPKTPVAENSSGEKGDKKPPKVEAHDPPDDPDMIGFPLPFKGKSAGVIRVPTNLGPEDVKLIKLTIGVIEAYAAQTAADCCGVRVATA